MLGQFSVMVAHHDRGGIVDREQDGSSEASPEPQQRTQPSSGVPGFSASSPWM